LPKKTLELAEEADATLIVQVKDNQSQLLAQIEHECLNRTPEETSEDPIEKQHGRIEMRRYEVFDAQNMLKKWKKEWKHIRKIIRVTRYRESKGHQPTQEVSYYISNEKHGLTAKGFGQCIRNHWFIENKLHYVKDQTFKEDFSVKRVNPFIFSLCIDLSLNMMRSNDERNIRKALFRNSINFSNTCANYTRLL
jgi:predicted transposase YbfD/YdcC